jgi:hypothetical protein
VLLPLTRLYDLARIIDLFAPQDFLRYVSAHQKGSGLTDIHDGDKGGALWIRETQIKTNFWDHASRDTFNELMAVAPLQRRILDISMILLFESRLSFSRLTAWHGAEIAILLTDHLNCPMAMIIYKKSQAWEWR